MIKSYMEQIQEVKEMNLQKECIKSLKKVLMSLGSSRVEYMNSGSYTPLLRSIFDLENIVLNEIKDLEN